MNKAARVQHMRKKVLTAAHALVNENGHDNVSLREIARRVEYSPAGLYEYFTGIDDIIDALVAQTEERLVAVLQAAQKGENQLEDLEEMGVAYWTFAVDFSDDFLLLFHRTLSGGHPHEIFFTLRTMVSHALRNGDLLAGPGYTEEQITQGIWALFHGMAMLSLSRPGFSHGSAHRENIRRHLNGLRG